MVRELAVDANQNFLREMFAEQSVPEEEWWIKIEINEVPPTPESDLGDGLRDHLKRIHTKILQGTQEFRASLRAFEERGLIRRGKEPGTYCILSFCS
jgi:hypothetical protein